MSAFRRIAEHLQSAQRVFMPLHRFPDGDAVGSALALYNVVRRWEKPVFCTTVDPVPTHLKFLPNADKVIKQDLGDLALKEEDVLVCLDAPHLGRFSAREDVSVAEIKARVCNLDHHPSNEHYGHENIVVRRVATAEILVDLLDILHEPLDAPVATCLLTGIITDTESFWHEATPEVMETAARLQRAGANYDGIVTQALRSIPLTFVRLWAEVLNNFHLDEETRSAWAAVTHRAIRTCNIPPLDTHAAAISAIDRLLRNLHGVDVAFLCAEEEEGLVRTHLRSRTPAVDVSELARKFGGGGHPAAAGFSLRGNPEQAATMVLAALAERKASF